MQVDKETKQKHLLEIENVFINLFEKLKVKYSKKTMIKYIFRLLDCKHEQQTVYKYKRNNSINKKVLGKLEIIKKL